jgi:hypothetical protein
MKDESKKQTARQNDLTGGFASGLKKSIAL